MKKIMRSIGFLLIFVIMALSLTGCNSAEENEAEDRVHLFFESLQNSDKSTFQEVTILEEKSALYNIQMEKIENKKIDEIGKFASENIAYKIRNSSEKESGIVVVTADVTSIDFNHLLKSVVVGTLKKSLFNPAISQENFQALALDELEKNFTTHNLETKTKEEVKIVVRKVDGTWKVSLDSKLEKRMFGRFDPITMMGH